MSLARTAVLLASLLVVAHPATAVTINAVNTSVSESFDTLSSTLASSALPAGWAFQESGSGANSTYGVGTGSSSTGNTFSFGASGSTERALGTLRSSSVSAVFGTSILNQTGGLISDLAIAFTGEQWRLGALHRVDRLDFAFSLDATSLSTGAWTDVDALDFTAPVTSGTTGLLNGNLPTNQSLVSHTLLGLNLHDGAQVWLRWSDYAAAGSNDGLAIDEFSVTALRAPTMPASVPDALPLGPVVAVVGALLCFHTRFSQARRACDTLRA